MTKFRDRGEKRANNIATSSRQYNATCSSSLALWHKALFRRIVRNIIKKKKNFFEFHTDLIFRLHYLRLHISILLVLLGLFIERQPPLPNIPNNLGLTHDYIVRGTVADLDPKNGIHPSKNGSNPKQGQAVQRSERIDKGGKSEIKNRQIDNQTFKLSGKTHANKDAYIHKDGQAEK